MSDEVVRRRDVMLKVQLEEKMKSFGRSLDEMRETQKDHEQRLKALELHDVSTEHQIPKWISDAVAIGIKTVNMRVDVTNDNVKLLADRFSEMEKEQLRQKLGAWQKLAWLFVGGFVSYIVTILISTLFD